MAYRKDQIELEKEFHEKLITDHGYTIPEFFKRPGEDTGVQKQGVEICTVSELGPQNNMVRIDIGVPIDMLTSGIKIPQGFREIRAAGKKLLEAKADLFIITRRDIARVIPQVLDLTEAGIKLLLEHPDKIISEWSAVKNTLFNDMI